MYDFIINPAARSGMGKRTWKKVKKILLKHQILQYIISFHFAKSPVLKNISYFFFLVNVIPWEFWQ